MIIEVKTVEILAKQKMQFEATTVVKEEKLINLILREYAKVILNPLFMHSNEKIEEIIQEMKKVEEKIEKVF